MVATTPQYSSKPLDSFVNPLLTRRGMGARCAEALFANAADALSQFDISDLMDDEDPSTDSDVATVFMLVQRGEARLGEVEEALDRVANGTHGCYIGCGCCIPLVRPRSLRSTVSCIERSRHSSQQNCDVFDRDYLRAEQIRGRSLAGCGVSGVGGEQ